MPRGERVGSAHVKLAAVAVVAAGLAGCLGPPDPLEPAARGGGPGADAPPPLPADGHLTVAFVDVGQGDGAVWRLPSGHVAVLDCGPPARDGQAPAVVRHLLAMGVPPGARLSALVASHGHADHVGGCPALLDAFAVDHLYDPWYEGADAPATYVRFREAARAEGGVVHTVGPAATLEGEVPLVAGEPLALPASAAAAGVAARILAPAGPEPLGWGRIAAAGLVVRLSFGGVDLCFQGDVGAAEEAALAALPGPLDCEVLLVGHHGSADASTAPWLARLGPRVAVVSAGDNPYGHPSHEALCRVQQAGARLYLTRDLGTVTVRTDGASLTVAPDRPMQEDACAAASAGAPAPPPQAPPPSPPPPAEPQGASPPLVATALADPAQPCQHATVALRVHADQGGAPAAGAEVTSTWRYRTTTSHANATTDAHGDATLARRIGSATAGHEVVVEVEVRHGGAVARAEARFTPRAC